MLKSVRNQNKHKKKRNNPTSVETEENDKKQPKIES